MERTLSPRWTVWLAALLTVLAMPGGGAAANADTPRLITAILSEENLPPVAAPPAAGTSPGAASPAAPAATPEPGALEDWEAVPSGRQAAPSGAIPAAPTPRSEPRPTPTPEPRTSSAEQTGVPQSPSSEPPEALDTSTISTAPDLSQASLEPEIKQAASPALAASLRMTEEARKRLAAGDTDAAMRMLGRAVSIDSGNPFEYFYLARVYMVRKNYRQALTFLKRAEIGFAARPDWLGETIGYEGTCYEQSGRLSDAQSAYQRALADAPNNLMARIGYGRLAGAAAPPAALDAPPPVVHDVSPPPAVADDGAAPAEAPPPPPPSVPAPAQAAPAPDLTRGN
jgi:Tetratricopeptide repeat-like domain